MKPFNRKRANPGKDDALNNSERGSTNQLTMNRITQTQTQNKFQLNSTPSRSELLEQSRLSRLPSLPKRAAFNLPDFDNTPTKSVAAVAVCAGCNTRLDLEDTIQKKFSGCRKCISIYGRLDAAREENAKRETRELLERFAAEVKHD